MKDLENIVGDIYKVVDSGADIDKEDMDYFLNTMRDELTSFLSKKDIWLSTQYILAVL